MLNNLDQLIGQGIDYIIQVKLLFNNARYKLK